MRTSSKTVVVPVAVRFFPFSSSEILTCVWIYNTWKKDLPSFQVVFCVIFKSIYLNIRLPTTGCLMPEGLYWECKRLLFKQQCSLWRCAVWGERWAWMNECSWPSQHIRNCLHHFYFQQTHQSIPNALKQTVLKHNGFILCAQELLPLQQNWMMEKGTESQNHGIIECRMGQDGTNLERSSGPSFCGKGSIEP